MAYKVSVSIADVSPNMYAAAQQANLNQTQVTQLDQFARTVKLNKNLLRRPTEIARNEFSKLDPQVKEMLQFLYPDASYAQPEPGIGDMVAGFAKGTATTVLIRLIITTAANILTLIMPAVNSIVTKKISIRPLVCSKAVLKQTTLQCLASELDRRRWLRKWSGAELLIEALEELQRIWALRRS
jgi:hypothetical protein